MRLILATLVLSAPVWSLTQTGSEESTEALIKKLSSASFRERNKATKVLQGRPEAIPALRGALESGDLETRKRAAEILEYFERQREEVERRPVRELQAAAKAGRVDRVIELVAPWPKEKFTDDVWLVMRDLLRTLIERHEKAGGAKIDQPQFFGDQGPPVLSAKRITEFTPAMPGQAYFLRAGEVDVDYRRRKKSGSSQLQDDTFTVAAGRVRTFASISPLVIFAQGPVELKTDKILHSVIVSCTDINLKADIGGCLIIARGSVVIPGILEGNRIIAGKSITRTSNNRSNTFSENDSNPLGFIRWADAPKDKPAPKSK